MKEGKLKPLGSKTKFGKIVMIGSIQIENTQRERYYWMIDKRGTISMMPAVMIEK